MSRRRRSFAPGSGSMCCVATTGRRHGSFASRRIWRSTNCGGGNQPVLSRLFAGREPAIPDESDSGDAIPALMDPFDMERSLAERDLVNRALLRVPERQRAAVLLWAAHGLTCAEIAAALETTEVNARQMLSRGRARFREVYEQAARDS